MADFERDLVLAVANRLDHDRLETAHRYTQKCLEGWYPESLSSANVGKIRADGVGDTGDHDSIMGAMYRTGTTSYKARPLLQYPSIVLVVGMWWALHPESEYALPAELHFGADDEYNDLPPGALAKRVLELADDLFEPLLPAHSLLSEHLKAGYDRADHMALMGGALWSVSHAVVWSGSLLWVQEHPDALTVDRFWSWPLDLTAQLLRGLREEYLVGLPQDHPYWEARRMHLRYVQRVREAEQGAEDGEA